MVFLLVTALVAGVGIFILGSLIEWMAKKAAPAPTASFGRVGTTVAVFALTTLLVVFVMTRPAVVGPYEQWTFQNIGGQLLGGVLAAGVKLWLGAPEQA